MTEFNWATSVERQQRLAAQIKRAQAQLRAARHRQLQQYGAFVERAGLTALTPEALFGLLLEGAQQIHDAVTVRRWQEAGSQTLATAAPPALPANVEALGEQASGQGASAPAAAAWEARHKASQTVS
jgi:hypothetical protein